MRIRIYTCIYPFLFLFLSVLITDNTVSQVSCTGTAAVFPTLGINFGPSTSRRRLTIDSADSADHGSNTILLTGIVEQGKAANVLVESDKIIENLVFRLSSTCSEHDGYVVIDDVSIPQGTSNIGLPIPWHLALVSKCGWYVIEAYVPGSRESALVSEPFTMNSCARSPSILK